MIRSLDVVGFSPTRSTWTFLKAVAEGLGVPDIRDIDLTLPPGDGDPPRLTGDAVLLGVPVYCGRAAPVALERFKRLKASGIPAVLVAVYGNRAYEDALAELYDAALEMGCRPVAAGAFVAEHSFSTPHVPLSVGRPDASDSDAAVSFGKAVRAKLEAHPDPAAVPLVEIPGNRPYRDGCPFAGQAPATDAEKCVLCGECAKVCPTGAITVDEIARTRNEDCILCCACVKACPEQARTLDLPEINAIRTKLSENFATPRPPETFL